MKRLASRVATVASLAALTACTEMDISRGILEWSAIVAVGIALIVLGVKRKRIDLLAVASMIAGGGVVVAAGSLLFSPSRVAKWRAGSTGGGSAGPVVGLILAVAVAIVGSVVLVRRHRWKATAKLHAAAVPEAGAKSR